MASVTGTKIAAKVVKAPKTTGTAAKSKPADPIRKIREAAELMKQVSDATRLQVLLLLSEKEMNVTELCAALQGMSQPAVSHHLQLLRSSKLIEPRRDGKNNYYSLTEAGEKLITAARPLVV